MKSRINESSPEATRLGRRLFAAIDKGDLVLARDLLDRGADVNYHDPKKGSSPLIRAIARRRGVKFLELLFKRGADIHYKGPLAGTPLLNAVAANDLEALKFLVRCMGGALQPEIAGDLLIEACGHGFPDIAKELISQRADVNLQNEAGLTALMQTVMIERLDLAQLLIKAGASPHAGGSKARAVDWAAEFGSPEMKKLLGIKPKE